jgi:hypothetical protein
MLDGHLKRRDRIGGIGLDRRVMMIMVIMSTGETTSITVATNGSIVYPQIINEHGEPW